MGRWRSRTLATVGVLIAVWGCGGGSTPSSPPTTLTTEVVARDLTLPWGLAPLPDWSFVVTERGGRISRFMQGGRDTLAAPDDAAQNGDAAGLFDIRFRDGALYLAYANRNLDLVVAKRAWPNGEWRPLTSFASDGRTDHFGGRLLLLPDGGLLVSTGERQTPEFARDPNSPWGKIWRVDTATGERSLVSKGHRNPQGLALDATGSVWATEHGPSGYDAPGGRDEVNLIRSGGDYGWPDSVGDDTLPGTVAPAWHSGAPPAVAPGGAEIPKTGPWARRLLVPCLRGERLLVFRLDANRGVATLESTLIAGEFGRLRTAVALDDGSVLVATSNGGGQDRILRLTLR